MILESQMAMTVLSKNVLNAFEQNIWWPLSLSELTPIILYMKLTHLGLESFI